MKIFLDTANLEAIKKYSSLGVIDGITTNPSHMSHAGTDPKKLILDICALMPEGEISVEITEKSAQDVYKQAKSIAALHPNIVVKIPCYKDYYPVIKTLVDEGVSLNITLVFTLMQSLMMCKLGVTMISPFVGRWDDIDVEGIELLEEIREMVDRYDYETEILAASIRSLRHFHKSIQAGADIITLPVDIFEKSLEHPLTIQGIGKFDADWQKLGIRQFP